MSFTAEVKEELTRVPPVCSHCDKAVLAALVRTEGTLMFGGTGRYRVELATDVPSVARLIIKLLHQIYQLKTELTVRRSVLHKTPNYLIVLPMQPGLDGALHDAGVLSATGLEMGIDPHLVEKQCCTAAYLRGAFLGSGFISNPRGDFHFEMTLESEDLARGIVAPLVVDGLSQERFGHFGVPGAGGSAPGGACHGKRAGHQKRPQRREPSGERRTGEPGEKRAVLCRADHGHP